jgi:hypothetical protein
METKNSLREKLQRAKQNEPVEAKYPTGIIIDTRGPQGNVFYLFGVANDLLRKLALSDEEIAEFKQERDQQTSYQGHKDLMRKWFGIIFIGGEDDE